MNSLDKTIKKIVSIKRVNTKNRCGFRFSIIWSTWGGSRKGVLWGTTKKEFEVGESFSD